MDQEQNVLILGTPGLSVYNFAMSKYSNEIPYNVTLTESI